MRLSEKTRKQALIFGEAVKRLEEYFKKVQSDYPKTTLEKLREVCPTVGFPAVISISALEASRVQTDTHLMLTGGTTFAQGAFGEGEILPTDP